MQELNMFEVDQVGGAWAKDLSDAVSGALWGAVDGALTGLSLGGKWATAGGIGFGALSQLVGYAVTPFVAGALAGIIGFAFGKQPVLDVIADYRKSIGQGGTGGGGSL